MADAKKEKEVTSSVEIEKFYLTDKVRLEGYKNRKFNLIIDFERDFRGNATTKYASTGKIENGEFISDRKDYLTGLTSEMVYVLGIAKVIKIKKSQRDYFRNYLNSIQRISEED